MLRKFPNSGEILVAAALLCVIVATFLVNQPIAFPLDDAYITIANAHQILTAQVDGFGQNQPTGATSLIHLIMLAALGTVVDLPTASFILATIAASLYVVGLYRLLRLLSANEVLASLGTLGGFLGGAAWFQLMNGLETGLAMAAVAWAAYLAQYPDHTRIQVLLAVLIGALPFIRPELGVLSATLVAAVLIRLRRLPYRLLGLGFCTALTVIILASMAWMVTGELIPRTAGAKIAFFAESSLPLAEKIYNAALAVFQSPLAVVLTGMVFLPRIRGGWAFIGFAILFWTITALSLPSGLSHNLYRYLYVLVPLGLAGWAVFSVQNKTTGGTAALVTGIGASVLIATFFVSGWGYYRTNLRVTADQETLVIWAQANLPGDARILIHDAGYFAWRTNFHLVDLVGLKSLSSIAVHRRLTLASSGTKRGEAISQIAHKGRVTHAIILERPFWRDIHRDLRQQGWQVEPLRADPGQLYRLYRLTPPK